MTKQARLLKKGETFLHETGAQMVLTIKRVDQSFVEITTDKEYCIIVPDNYQFEILEQNK